ncbi:hypothetical protein D3C84_358530 [compost metagenome]
MNDHELGGAEKLFRAAFERLKENEPVVLPRGTAVSQNNVAKEAGRDPSALKKERYPLLITEIKEYVANAAFLKPDSPGQRLKVAKRVQKDLKERVALLEADRDLAQSLLVQAHETILAVAKENEALRAQLPPSNISELSTHPRLPRSDGRK